MCVCVTACVRDQATHCNELVVFHFDDVADDHFVPQLIHELPITQNPRQPVVYMAVATVPLLRRHTSTIAMTTHNKTSMVQQIATINKLPSIKDQGQTIHAAILTKVTSM